MSAPPCIVEPAAQAHWFKKEVHAHDGQLRAYLRGAFPRVRDVDDVVQESYLRIWRRQAVRPIQSAKAFLFTIARRLAIDWVRHEKISAAAPVEELESPDVLIQEPTVDAVSRAELIALLVDAVDSLPARCREVVILRKFKLLSARETAGRLGIREHTVDMQLSRGTARIRAHLAARGITRILGRDF
ncbi:MAG TPA: RNA polymerase sigma factor [Opitutaceae bacterium]|nr:RNA polymerase sigma factor [Opitutaceae bacterium]